MEVNDTDMLSLVVFVFMSSVVLMFGALYCTTRITRVCTHCHSHNRPPGTRERNNRRNSVNLSACTHNQRRPEENDERF